MIPIADGLFMLRKSWGSNIYVACHGGLTLVDSGFPLDARRLLKKLDRCCGAGPELMIATHCHMDHMGSMARIKRACGAEVAAHGLDARIIEGEAPYATFKLDPLRAAYYRVLGPLYRYECVPVDLALSDGDVLDVLGGLEVVEVPGHTEGSIALYQREKKLLFTGDTVRNENGVLDGPPPEFTPDLELSWDSIATRLAPLDFDVLLPGHGDPVTSGGSKALSRMIIERRPSKQGV